MNVTYKKSNLCNFVPTSSRKLRLADKSVREAMGTGDMHVWSHLPDGSRRHLVLLDVLFVPSFETSLVFLKGLTKKGHVLVDCGHHDCLLSRVHEWRGARRRALGAELGSHAA